MRMQAREEAIRAVEDAIRAPVAETPLLGSHFEPEHEDEEPQPKGRSVPPPPNAFSEAEALRWPAIREALSDETRSSVGQGLAVRVVRVHVRARGHGGPACLRRQQGALQLVEAHLLATSCRRGARGRRRAGLPRRERRDGGWDVSWGVAADHAVVCDAAGGGMVLHAR